MRRNYIVPNVGDIVEYHISKVSGPRGSGIAKVLKVRLYLDMYNQMLTLVEIDELEDTYSKTSNMKRSINVAHIVRIVKSNPAICRTLNLYRDATLTSDYRTLPNLVFHILSFEQVRILRPIDCNKVRSMYNKNGIGLDTNLKYTVKILNRKKFKRWVMSNWTKMLYSESEWNKIVEEGLKRQRRDYEAMDKFQEMLDYGKEF